METLEPSTWPYLAGGLASLAAGWSLRTPARLDRLCRLLGSGPATEPERRWLPLALLFAGAGWLCMWLSTVIPFTGGQRPYAIVILTVALTPLAALAFLGVLLWLVVLRRTGR